MEVDYNESLILENIKKNHTVIGVAAGLTKRKGIDQAIKLLKENSNYFLVVIGDGVEMGNLVNLSKVLNVEDRCLFLGYKKNVYGYFKYFDVYALLSYAEGFPLVLIEAASLKLPVVCSNLDRFKEMFDNNEVCYYKLDDIDSLNSSIQILLNRKEEYSSNIYEKYKKNYTADKMAANYLSLYNRILGHIK